MVCSAVAFDLFGMRSEPACANSACCETSTDCEASELCKDIECDVVQKTCVADTEG